MKNIIIILIYIILAKSSVAQGCVAIRSNGNTCSMGKPGDGKGWDINLNNRYFKSYKHFVGTIEQKQRVDSGTEVINRVYSMDITLTRNFNSRWSLVFTLPVISNTRSSKYEHYGNGSKSPNARRTTSSFGIGDARLSVYRWLLNPGKIHNGNIQAGLGLKLPTGDYRCQDLFYKNDTTYTVGPVDQSIQLGDGGTGIALELKGFYNFSQRWGAYGETYYLINPREQNGISTTRGGTVSTSATRYFTSTMSVPDQYMARGGINYMTGMFNFSAGVRIEGIPAGDLVGGDKGFRRPGYVISAEPVASYTMKKIQLYTSLPFALQRNRTQSYSDKLQTKDSGIKRQGDAAFADYFVNFGATIRL